MLDIFQWINRLKRPKLGAKYTITAIILLRIDSEAKTNCKTTPQMDSLLVIIMLSVYVITMEITDQADDIKRRTVLPPTKSSCTPKTVLVRVNFKPVSRRMTSV